MKELIVKLKTLYPKCRIRFYAEYISKFNGEESIEYFINVINGTDPLDDLISESFKSFQAAKNYVNSLETHPDTVDNFNEVVKNMELVNG